jgi:NADH:ubiquinone oxidoreductase subunit 6 (subunit J)
MGQLVAVVAFGVLAIGLGAGVFRTSSMMRSALSLLGSMAALGGLFLAQEVEFLGVLQLMMMATEMAIMAVFMVMFMMDPGGLGQMEMTHQKRLAIVAGVVAALAGLAMAILPAWAPVASIAPQPAVQVHDLGIELMSRSMLIFETAGLSILLAMIAATVLAISRTRR